MKNEHFGNRIIIQIFVPFSVNWTSCTTRIKENKVIKLCVLEFVLRINETVIRKKICYFHLFE